MTKRKSAKTDRKKDGWIEVPGDTPVEEVIEQFVKGKAKPGVKSAADRAERRAKGKPVAPEPTPLDPPKTSAKHAGGRPTVYKPEFARLAKAMCNLGATDQELADEFGVTTQTIWRWQSKHAEFCYALRASKKAYDVRIERSLAQRAIGYTYNSEKVFQFQGTPVRIPCVEHVPPDPGAAKMWLTARCSKWREVQRHEVTGRDGGAIETKDVSDIESAQRVAYMLGRAMSRMVVKNDADPVSKPE